MQIRPLFLATATYGLIYEKKALPVKSETTATLKNCIRTTNPSAHWSPMTGRWMQWKEPTENISLLTVTAVTNEIY